MIAAAKTEDRVCEVAQVLIVGGGCVGMIAALDLASRGIDVIVAEKSTPETPTVPRANHLSARTMEIFRRLGIADRIRTHGLPDDFPNDVAFVTTLTGHQLARLPIPCRRDRFGSVGYIDSDWPTPEPAHRCNQMYFEPAIRQEILAHPHIRVLFETEIVDFVQDEEGVTATGLCVDNGAVIEIHADYMIGCDGGRSMVRKRIGAVFEGVDVVSRNRMALVKSPELLDRLAIEPAWMTWFMTQEGHGSVHAIDGKELWCFICTLPDGEENMESLDRDKVIQAAIGADIPYDTLHAEDWYGRRLISSKFGDRRVFLGGDASHIWIPMAGYGMNAGIADVTNLTWKMAAVLNGWASPTILETFAIERRPVTEQVSKIVANIATVNYATDLRKNPPSDLFEDGEVGEKARKAAGDFLIDANMDQFNCAGLNFGAVYSNSPIISGDGSGAPPFELGRYTPSTVPGCRTPHLTLENGESLYDRMGSGFTLLRFDPSINVASLVAGAERRGLPLQVVDVDQSLAAETYDVKLVLSRPDQYVAWSGNTAPTDALSLIDLVRGAALESKPTQDVLTSTQVHE